MFLNFSLPRQRRFIYRVSALAFWTTYLILSIARRGRELLGVVSNGSACPCPRYPKRVLRPLFQPHSISSSLPAAGAAWPVPADGDPAWAKMLKHGLVVGHYPAGSPCISAHTVSGWRDCTNRRPLSLVLFPRAAGARTVRLDLGPAEANRVLLACRSDLHV